MKHSETQYLDIIKDILDNGIYKEAARPGMPGTRELFFKTMTFDLSEGYPLFTTKKMAWKSCLTELTWFLKGDTNIKYLVDNGCPIWIEDAYKYYKRKTIDDPLSKEEWLEKVKNGDIWETNEQHKRYYGDLGRVYGSQWRSFDGGGYFFDQIEYIVDSIKNRPNERYHIINAWNGSEFLTGHKDVALPTCHVYYQFCVRGNKLDMMMLQRSCDMFLGVPFDIASGAALLTLIAHHTGYEPGIFNWVGNSCHLYENHIEQAQELLNRTPFEFPKLQINWKENLKEYTREDFNVIDYNCHSRIVAPLCVGV